MAAATIVERFFERVAEHPDRVALRYKSGDAWRDITWRDYGLRVEQAAAALIAAGFEPGDRIALLSANRPEWHVIDLACMTVGGATAAIYVTNSPEQVAYIVAHSGARIAFVDTSERLGKILKVRPELPALERIVVFDGSGDDDGSAVPWARFLQTVTPEAQREVARRRAAVTSDDIATFVYTSGTTGPPKAVMLTHGNIWWTCVHVSESIPIGDTERARALSYLPLSHIAERMISHLMQIYNGTQTWFAQSLETLLADLQDCRPTYFFGVPRVWEKFYNGLQARLENADPDDRRTKLARRALEVGRRVAELEQEAVARGGKMRDARLPPGLKLRHALLDRLVLAKVRRAFGLDACGLALSAAAPLNPELIWSFHALGIRIAEGYGQSEDTGPTTWNPPDAIRIGTVGPPISGVEVRLAEDGEILVRGGNVMKGYYKDDAATREMIDDDGWMHSGDVGSFDANGYLTITDRKKDIIITAGGKNIAPQELENRLTFSPLISQAVVIGDGRPFLTALITLSEEDTLAWARHRGIEGDLATVAADPRTLEEVRRAIAEVNARLARVEEIKKARVLTREFLVEEGEITPTLKVRRKTVNEAYAGVIEDLYRSDSPDIAVAEVPEHR